MAQRVIRGLDELKALVGQVIGVSDWVEITQDQVQKFADATGDHQWIHCDPERAKLESPYGAPVAHGFLTLSLGPALAQAIFTVEGVKMGVNYGLNRVRFPAAVKVGSRVRMTSQLTELKEGAEGVTATYKQTFEVEGEGRPCCVAEMMARLYF
ncbi:MAG: MaoC family dehydratase [Planctomycetaceae bacterium]|nr:MaoC family dehydratase [Planctomycetaceae bacterium]